MDLPIYLDHAATTPARPEVLDAMLPFFSQRYGNPSAVHMLGLMAREAVEKARDTLAECLCASPDEIVFTSGGTESDNMAVLGAAWAAGAGHILSSPIEHHAVLEPLELLAGQGWEVEHCPVDGAGRVDPDEVRRRLRPDTVLVSIMHSNNEVGTMQPVSDIGRVCREAGVLLHTDAVQSVGRVPIDVRELGADLVSFTAHKFYGPKGCGGLYVRRGVRLTRYQSGGGQERGRRAGTLNVPGIVGLARAAQLAVGEMRAESARLCGLRDRLIARVMDALADAMLTGHPVERLPHNAHFCFGGIEGESLVLALDAAGICASAGSACSAGSTEPSHVLTAMSIPRELARGAVRLTMGRSTTEEALDYTADTLIRSVRELRQLAARRLRSGQPA